MSHTTYPDIRVERTRRRLRNAFISNLKRYAYEDIKVSNLTREAKVDRTSFYNHYKCMDHLRNDVMDYVIRDLITAYREPYQQKKSFIMDEFEPDSITIFNAVYEHKNTYEILIKSQQLPLFQYKLTQEITRVALNDYTCDSPKINLTLHSIFYAHAITGLIVHWVQEGFHYTPQNLAKQLIQIIKYTPRNNMILKST